MDAPHEKDKDDQDVNQAQSEQQGQQEQEQQKQEHDPSSTSPTNTSYPPPPQSSTASSSTFKPMSQDLPNLRTNPSDATPTRTARALSSAAPSEQNSIANSDPSFSPWSVGSDKQLGYHSAASDISGDRVFPIRSVISVDPNSSKITNDDYFPTLPERDGRSIPVQVPGAPRADTGPDLRRSDTVPANYHSRAHSERIDALMRRKNTLSGPMSSIQLDANRHGSSTTPLQLDISTSDNETETEESGPIGHSAPALAHAVPEPDASSAGQSSADVPLVTTRFTHVVTDDGHAVITGRDGVLQRCEDEPIHTPGAIQTFGALVALREENDGCFIARYVSENSERMLGYSPKQLFHLKNFLDILTEEQQDNLLDHIDFIRDEDADPAVNGPEVFSLSIRSLKRKSTKLWCAIHINPAHPDLIICEFELDDDVEYPLRPVDEMTPNTPHDTLQSNPTLEEIEDSTEVLSKPLRILRSARKRRGEQGAMQVFDIMSQVQEQLSSAPNLEAFLKILVGIVKELTGFHRVMIYQFDSSFNGKVVTELVDTSMTRDLYKGLHFPASDIPRQARDLYKLNKVRLLYDRDQDTSRIVCRTKEDLDVPLDMSHSYLRAMSPIHIKYLRNMAVRSSMSISINAFNELWGLISCHSYGNHGMRVSFPIRKMCRLVGDTASRNIERLSYASRLQARKLINTAPTDKNPSGYIIASSEDLLKLFDADFGLLSIKGETKIMGLVEQSQEALAMLEYLRMRQLTSVVASQDVKEDFPDLRYPPGFQIVAGLLYVPLSVGGNDFIVFFRKGQIKEVKWAGNPYEKFVREGTAGYLEPRKSFKTWNETVVGKCREWNEEQVETAAVLCLVYGKFIEVWRQKEKALQNSKLTQLLLANSAHEVRTPLNAIINYLEIALEGSLDQETRDNLARSHSASKSLIYVINDLLDLTKTEEGQNLVKDEVFDLASCIREATGPFLNDAKRKGIHYTVVQHPGLPRFVHGDERRIRQALSNVTANAVAHTHNGHVKVEVFVSEVRDRHAVVDFVIEDSGIGMSASQLDTLFRDLEQVSSEETPMSGTQLEEMPREMRTLGLGLAVVARIVRNMDGQLRLKSEVGQGSRFVVQLPFLLSNECPSSQGDKDAPASGPTNQSTNSADTTNTASTAPASLTAAPEGEITLVDRVSSMTTAIEGGDASGIQGSRASQRSVSSRGSRGSQQSDADRLIDAISTPLSLNDREGSEFPLSGSVRSGGSSIRPTSRGAVSLGGRSASLSRSPVATKPRSEPGSAGVVDSKTPIRAVKIPDEYSDVPARPQASEHSGILFEMKSNDHPVTKAATESVTSGGTQMTEQPHLQVLVAEDDPINMKILRKRLERVGHGVHHTVNGEDCAAAYRERSKVFDVVLMDMQMPIVDGLTSTKMIRSMEVSGEHQGHSSLANSNYRIPIFAVSASLVEREKQTYVDAGFDGWILKPIDFKRLNTLLAGISDEEVRKSCLYEPGQWERGGWFLPRVSLGDSVTSDETTPKAEADAKDKDIGTTVAAEEAKAEGDYVEPEPST
ncbi:cyanobacterial phytochrome B [Fusarium beomiforme]|uniref:Cyanobacterial phytochrome B n=1 Tax=Fusarium beomiforme TaxID=44412 RepID=A0A9P5E7Q7_9HYPO|nr:cyanobacterial phytochrome B [Fusarium beomiforme]